MPKPFSNKTGTGAHYHLSLGSKTVKNLFHDDSDKNGLGLSQMGYHFLGGLLAHARALSAIVAPTINSYKRLVVGHALSGATWAPAYIAYGNNNRTACVRIPYGRLEMRLPDGACNPYLATVAILAAGMDGVERKLDPGKPINENLYTWSQEQLDEAGIKLLPQNMLEAIDEFAKDTMLHKALGEALPRSSSRSSAWSGWSTRTTSASGSASATWNSSDRATTLDRIITGIAWQCVES
jgi:glutamine synthetase